MNLTNEAFDLSKWNTNELKSFAKDARKELLKSVALKIKYVLSENSFERRENPKAIIELENKIKSSSKKEVIEEVSYTWFNRFIALQYMDINGFNDVQVILPIEGKIRPEILSNAISGEFDSNYISENTRNMVSSLLDGRSPSNDPEKESYRLLLVSFCNKLHAKMPFLFSRISDYTELLIPDDLLSNESILTKVRNLLTKENCQDVEIIGWLYQFYISEKKEEVFSGLKNKKRINPNNIPAATQLFTPNWIVKYLVQNSLGSLWMLNNPNSNLIDQMEYYISPKEFDNDFPIINSPEEIKLCDPACGSGHILTYSFDLLYSIYEEEGYNPNKIPFLIFKNNLVGIEIDKPAGALASFALFMKARRKQKNFFKNFVQPNICVLENIKLETNEINQYFDVFGRDLFTNKFETTIRQFEESDNYGSLIQPALEDIKPIIETLQSIEISNKLFKNRTHQIINKVLNQTKYLNQKYHIVIANPPYMAIKGMNKKLNIFLNKHFPDSKYDLYAAFLERALLMTINKGIIAMINMQSWMFLSSYEKLRKKLILNTTLLSMAHIGPRGFDTIGGEVVSTTSFIIQNKLNRVYKGQFYRLVDGNSESEKSRLLKEGIANSNCGYFFRVSSKDLEKIDGAPIIYWLSDSLRSLFNSENKIDDIADKVTKGIYTGDNNRFLRLWYETSFGNKGWKKYDKAGGSRRWFGSAMHILDWRNDGEVLSKFKGAGIGAMKYFDKPHLVWSGLTSGNPSFRYADKYVWFDDASPSIVGSQASEKLLSFLNCNISTKLLMTLNPTINYQIGDVKRIPVGNLNDIDSKIAKRCIEISRFDWDSYEISWDFKSSPLLSFNSNLKKIEIAYNYFRKDREKITNEMILLEEENNRLFIEKYRLHNELKKNIENHEITLNCNPAYRYGDKCIPRVQEENFLKDTLKEFISYSVGCMFGRYSLEQPGLILANQGENLADYLKRIPYPSFKPDADNIIPILSLDWFEDDITARFKKFLRITFSNENFEDNLRFIENSIGKDIRKYFLIEFYKDHIQTYKKRPIYWMFSSPKGSFNALIYMHLYKKDTVSILLEKYLSEFLLKLRAKRNIFERLEVNNDSYSKEKTKAIKEIQKIDSILSELKNWEKEVISPLASQFIEIDLDDGVKVNYSKFGTALKKVSGLN